jgi:hypothetical protein
MRLISWVVGLTICMAAGGVVAQERGWVADDKTHCRLWLGSVDTDDVVSVEWSGDCVDGLASGQGELTTRHKAKDHGRIQGAVLGEQRTPLWLQRTVGPEYQKFIPGEPERQTFKGTLRAGKREGHGVMQLSNGYKYDGAWKNGLREGKGVETWSEGSDGRYDGHFHEDHREGSGTYRGPDAYLYDGPWKNGLQEGKAVLYRDGDKYSGQWRAGKPDGQGTFSWRNGEAYEGAWQDGKPNGHGSWHARAVGRAQRVVTYTGEWRDGVIGDGSTTFTIACDGRNCTFR